MQVNLLMKQNLLGKNFKIYGTWEDPLFLVQDVASWIGYDKSSANKMIASIDDTEKLTGTIFRSGQKRDMWFLTEDGLYEVLMQSRKPIAKKFKQKVKEILRNVRKNGGYLATSSKDTPEEIMSKALVLAQKTIANKTKEIESLKDEQKANLPKVKFAEAVEGSNHSILIGELAKIIKQKGYDIGQNRLFIWLRDNGYLVKSGDAYNMPTQKSMELGIFEIKESLITHYDGHETIAKTTKVTGKGQVYFINLFIKKLYEEKYGDEVING